MRSINGARDTTGAHLTVDQYQRDGVLRMCHEVTREGDFTCRFTHASVTVRPSEDTSHDVGVRPHSLLTGTSAGPNYDE